VFPAKRALASAKSSPQGWEGSPPVFPAKRALASEGSPPVFLECDFKKQNGFFRSLELSKKLDFYRQDYCGCEFSRTKSRL
ncbi:MAG: epoxyqueuosine reductase QueH, partial [Spirochaetes bacterium]|nr:epoxyqueuosine reductase QueH [Spirochaetota bacterium]